MTAIASGPYRISGIRKTMAHRNWLNYGLVMLPFFSGKKNRFLLVKNPVYF